MFDFHRIHRTSVRVNADQVIMAALKSGKYRFHILLLLHAYPVLSFVTDRTEFAISCYLGRVSRIFLFIFSIITLHVLVCKSIIASFCLFLVSFSCILTKFVVFSKILLYNEMIMCVAFIC